jgi:hypothetical protein
MPLCMQYCVLVKVEKDKKTGKETLSSKGVTKELAMEWVAWAKQYKRDAKTFAEGVGAGPTHLPVPPQLRKLRCICIAGNHVRRALVLASLVDPLNPVFWKKNMCLFWGLSDEEIRKVRSRICDCVLLSLVVSSCVVFLFVLI